MSDAQPEKLDERVLVLAPTARDAATSRDLLGAAGVHSFLCNTIEDVCRETSRGAGAAVITAESILGEENGHFAWLLKDQPPWSDFPLIVLIPAGAESPKLMAALDAVGPMTLVKRPVHVSTLVSTVRSALRDRRRQYAVRDLLDERRRASEAFRQERERYRVTLGSIGDAVIATDTEGRVTFLNQIAEQLTGWDTAAQGRPLEEVFRIVNETTGAPVQNPGLRALKEGVVVGLANHTVLVAKDGTKRPLDDSAAPIRGADGAIVGAVLVFRDVSEKRRAEAALRENEEFHRFAAEAGRTGSWFVRLDTWECIFSPIMAELMGFPPGQTMASAEQWRARVVPADRAGLEAALAAAIDTGAPFDFEFRIALEDGTERWLYSRGGVVRDSVGKALRLHGASVDLTERKRAEVELREAGRRKDEFLAMLAHELRNPLAPIRNSLQVMRLAADDRAAFEQSRAMMERQVGHMVRLIDDLLDVSRVSRGKVELRKGRVDLAAVVAAAVETCRPAIDAAGHALTVSLPDRTVYLEADATRLAQVVGNLLNNAAKYTEPGGSIWLTAGREGDDAVVRVRDTGVGIPPEMLPTVFDLFTQVDYSADRAKGGLGIGLTLVKSLVEMHGGTVRASSPGRGCGSEFSVRLPALPGDSLDDARASEAKDFGRHADAKLRRILVVDDNRDAACSLAMLLEILGHDVRVAFDGPAALAAVEAARPDVVFLDLGMPGLSGYDVARGLRARPDGPGLRLVALTGWGAEDDRRRTREAGFDLHLVKPVAPAEVQSYLNKLDERSQAANA